MIKRFFLFFLFFNGLIYNGYANFEKSFNKLSKDNKIIIEKVNQYLLNLEAIKSNFIQFNDFNGNMAEGIFYMSKPNKLRFEYTNPFKSVLITNGNTTNFYDIDLDEVSVLPTNKTPISFLLRGQQNLKTLDSTIVSIEINEDNDIVINTRNVKNSNLYILSYIFDKDINDLKGLILTDENEETITLSFFNFKKNIALDKSLFIFKNPRLYNKRK